MAARINELKCLGSSDDLAQYRKEKLESLTAHAYVSGLHLFQSRLTSDHMFSA